jgi:cell division septation protein DedD
MRFRVAPIFALALATVTACGRGEEARPAAQQRPAPVRPAGKLYTVQIAAFVNADSARTWAGRLSSQGLPVWTTAFQLHGRTFHRVRIGAVLSVAEARKLGEMLEKRYSWSFWIAPITEADSVPDGAVQATRRILTG